MSKEFFYKSADTGEIVSEEFAKANPTTTYKQVYKEGITFEEYQGIIKKTAVFPQDIGIAYCAMGLAGEAGEVADKIKKLYRDKEYHDLDATGKSILLQEHKDSIAKELGDVLWYITAMANEIDVKLQEVAQMNYDKLLKRRATGTLQGSGDDRENI